MGETRIGLIMTRFLVYLSREFLVPLSSKSLATSDVSVRRRLGCLKVIPRLQTSFPPMVHNRQTYFLNISINTAPCFLRFQRRCDRLKNVFRTIYNTLRDAQGIP